MCHRRSAEQKPYLDSVRVGRAFRVVGCLGTDTLARQGKSVIILTTWRSETWRELAIIEAVAGIQFLACLDQLRNFVSYVFDLAKLSFSISLRVP
jgi:hypothetical protein